MPETFAEVVDRCLNTWLLGTYSAQFNALLSGINTVALEIDAAHPLSEVAQGSFIAIDDELMYVVERDATNNRLVVVRGVRGTQATTHDAGTPIEINPRFPRFLVRSMMREEIDSWPDELYTPRSFTAAVASSAGVIPIDGFYDTDYETLGVIRVRRNSLNTLDSRSRPTIGYTVLGDFAGAGGSISLDESVATATTFEVTVACKFIRNDFDDNDEIATWGLTQGVAEILELGAAYRLLMGRASSRLFPEAQGQSRNAAEVGARDIPAFANSLLGLRERALKREVERLYRRYGFGGQ